MTKHLQKVDHSYIRYANCWEDADLLLNNLAICESDKVLSIGSAGDNCFSLLSSNPKLVVAVDINPAQLELIKLKKASFQSLTHSEFLQFIGFENSNDRIRLFNKVKSKLSESSVEYWKLNQELLISGLIYQGKFEQYFRHFRTKLLPLIHSKRSIEKLFLEKSKEDQLQYFKRKWNSIRWRTIFRLFFSKRMMGWLGRDPKFLSEVDISVSDFILEQAQKQLGDSSCQTNYFLQFILKGKFDTNLPHYARIENFHKISSNIESLEIVEGYAQDAILNFGSFNKFNLSNIFEYMDESSFNSVVDIFKKGSLPKAKYAYWNLMVPRAMHHVSEEMKDLTPNTYVDRGFFYSSFHLNQLT